MQVRFLMDQLNPTATPAWAVGMQRIMPCVYADRENNWHMDLEGMCVAFGWAPSPENQQMALECFMEAFRDAYGRDLPLPRQHVV
jgi:hypothetical protein